VFLWKWWIGALSPYLLPGLGQIVVRNQQAIGHSGTGFDSSHGSDAHLQTSNHFFGDIDASWHTRYVKESRVPIPILADHFDLSDHS
jgi:hypothetical protein